MYGKILWVYIGILRQTLSILLLLLVMTLPLQENYSLHSGKVVGVMGWFGSVYHCT